MRLRLRPLWSEIVDALHADGIAVPHGPAPGAPHVSEESLASPPWFVRALLGLGAWVGACLIAVAAFAISGVKGLTPLGVAGIAAGLGLLRLKDGVFLVQLGLSLSLAGQLALGVGLGTSLDNDVAFAALAAILEVVLVVTTPAVVHRFFCTVLAIGAASAALLLTRWSTALDVCVLLVAAGTGWSWLDQPRRLRRQRPQHGQGRDSWSPVGYGLVVTLFGMLLLGILGDGGGHSSSPLGMTLGRLASVGIGLGTVALALRMAAEAGAPRPSPVHAVALAALAVLGFVTPRVPGVAAAVAVLLIAFHRRNPILLALAAIFLIAFLALLYYSLSATLLDKSLRLMATGAVLLVGAWCLRRESAR